MAKRKFKIGDRVKVIKLIAGASEDTLGKKGKIIEINPEGPTVQFSKRYEYGKRPWYYVDEELELVPKLNRSRTSK